MNLTQSESGQDIAQATREMAALDDLQMGGNSNEDSVKTQIAAKIRESRNEVGRLYQVQLARLRRIGVPDHVLVAAAKRCRHSGSTLVHELASAGQLDLLAYYCCLADDLGLPFVNSINTKRILADISGTQFRPGQTVQISCRDESGAIVLHMAPDLRTEARLLALFAKNPGSRSHFCICEPTTIVAAIELLLAQKSVDASINALHSKWPHMSAKNTLIPWQAFMLGAFSVLLPLIMLFAFRQTVFAVHVLSIVLFGLSVAIRIAAWKSLETFPKVFSVAQNDVPNFPVYSVLIALHKEADVIPQLVRSMARLDWPMSRLEVFYVCEADDESTISALGKIRLPAAHRIICVPAALPRTKPKALNFALERCTGEFVVIYDAEDRPNPLQLKEAWSRFRNSQASLACLQAPLDISNGGQSLLSKLFAFEYAAHFHGLLPFLAKTGVPLPLGGTSNHFRRAALKNCMAWDPYNVTEDADLGIRLYRLGYQCGVLSLSTLEDAPTSLKQWLPQRTRWIKGWMQTNLVHTRNIGELNNSIGLYNSIVFQILMAGFILSPLLYVVSILGFIYLSSEFIENSRIVDTLIIFDIGLFVLGHVGFALLALSCWRRLTGKLGIGLAFALPLYWLLASIAAWRAVWKLITAPHQWEKTHHEAAYDARRKTTEKKASQ